MAHSEELRLYVEQFKKGEITLEGLSLHLANGVECPLCGEGTVSNNDHVTLDGNSIVFKANCPESEDCFDINGDHNTPYHYKVVIDLKAWTAEIVEEE